MAYGYGCCIVTDVTGMESMTILGTSTGSQTVAIDGAVPSSLTRGVVLRASWLLGSFCTRTSTVCERSVCESEHAIKLYLFLEKGVPQPKTPFIRSQLTTHQMIKQGQLVTSDLQPLESTCT